MLYCRDWGPIAAVRRRRPPWSIYWIAFYPIFTAILSRHTHHKSAKPKSDHMPTTNPTKCLHQYLANEDI